MMNRFDLLKICVLLIILASFLACATEQSPGPQAMQGAMDTQPIADYRLRPGDQVDVKFFYHPELNESVIVGPDGKISLQLVDGVLAAGLTASQLDDLLTKEYANYLQNHSITVVVREYSGLRAFVGGEVERPNFVSLKGNMTVLQSIFAVEGFTVYARPENVIVLRKGLGNQPQAMVINLASVMSGEQMENDLYLMPGDIVYVPKTSIGKAGDFVDQYIKRVLMLDSLVRGAGQALGWYWVRDNVFGYDDNNGGW